MMLLLTARIVFYKSMLSFINKEKTGIVKVMEQYGPSMNIAIPSLPLIFCKNTDFFILLCYTITTKGRWSLWNLSTHFKERKRHACLYPYNSLSKYPCDTFFLSIYTTERKNFMNIIVCNNTYLTKMTSMPSSSLAQNQALADSIACGEIVLTDCYLLLEHD